MQHAIVNVLAPTWVKRMIPTSYQSIPSRGVHLAARHIKKAVRTQGNDYYVQLDIKKFYPSVQNKYLTDPAVLRIRCKRTLALVTEIIESLSELPLGNHISQYLGNLLLTSVDWYIKQSLGIKCYYRYCDDMVLIGSDPVQLQHAADAIVQKLALIELVVKPDYKVHTIDTKPLDFLGYVFTKRTVKLRKRIATNFKEAAKARGNVASYYGWCKHVGCLNLFHKHTRGLQWKSPPVPN